MRHHQFAPSLVALAVALIMALSTAPSAHAQAHVGSITNLSGSAQITRTGRSFAAVYGAPIDVGDNIATGPNGNVTITLTDGSQIELSGNSKLVIEQNLLNAAGVRESTRLGLLQGLVRAVVRVTAGTPPNFEVHTPNAVASARGTIFDVSYEKGVAR
ncbi:MAG TPA: FecR family protein [Candidatus Binataceae bacterium]|nr:FecR family protein [Candidatus Binataceae bacterium]